VEIIIGTLSHPFDRCFTVILPVSSFFLAATLSTQRASVLKRRRPVALLRPLVAISIHSFIVVVVVYQSIRVKKIKAFPYSIQSVGPGADPGVQAVSRQVTVSHPPGARLPLLSARPAVTSSAAEHHRPLAGTKLYCLVSEAQQV